MSKKGGSKAPEAAAGGSKSLRVPKDVYSRIVHDAAKDASKFVLGYEDRFLGLVEMSLLDFQPNGDVPWYVEWLDARVSWQHSLAHSLTLDRREPGIASTTLRRSPTLDDSESGTAAPSSTRYSARAMAAVCLRRASASPPTTSSRCSHSRTPTPRPPTSCCCNNTDTPLPRRARLPRPPPPPPPHPRVARVAQVARVVAARMPRRCARIGSMAATTSGPCSCRKPSASGRGSRRCRSSRTTSCSRSTTMSSTAPAHGIRTCSSCSSGATPI